MSLRYVKRRVNSVGAIHESPAHGRISHKPNGESQLVGANSFARKIRTNPTVTHNFVGAGFHARPSRHKNLHKLLAVRKPVGGDDHGTPSRFAETLRNDT